MKNKSGKKPIPKTAPQGKVVTKDGGVRSSKFSLNARLCLLLGILSFIVYANTLKNGYALDDFTVINYNTIVTRGVSAIPEILSTPYRRGYFVSANDLYRPLSLVMFAAEYQAFGKSPLPFHLINVLLFAGCVILLFLFLDKLFDHKKTAIAFIAALLFALHPIHTEVVANIKSRDELLCFFFAFLSLNIFAKYRQEGKIIQLLTGAFCFFLSLLSKETVITFLAIIPMVFFFYLSEDKARSVYITVCTVGVAIIFLSIRFSVLNYYHADQPTAVRFLENPLVNAPNFPSRIATAVLVLGYYIRLLIVPYPLVSDYSFNSIPFVSFANPWVLLSLAAYVFLIIFSVKRFIKDHKDPFAFGIFFFLISIALFSNIAFLIGANMGERFMFFPSVGFCLTVALLIEKWVVKTETQVAILTNKKILAIIVPVLLIYATIAIARNGDWADNYTLYATDLLKMPGNSKLNYYLGLELDQTVAEAEKDPAKQKQVRDEAITYLNKALAIAPDYDDAHAAIGNIYSRNLQYDSAEAHEKIALKLNPGNAYALSNLADIYIARKKYTEAIECCKKAIEINPNDANVQIRLGGAYFYNSQFDSAEIYYRNALVLSPKNPDAINNLGGVYFSLKKYPQAIELYKDEIGIRPEYVNSYTNIGLCYQNTGKYDSAIYYLNKAISVDPSFRTSYGLLAAIYKLMGKTDSANKYDALARK